jgi:hypothetical protein
MLSCLTQQAGQTTHHKLNRNLKHVSVIAYVSTVGESLTSSTRISQDAPSVREYLKKRRLRFGTRFILRARAKPYINAKMWNESIATVFRSNPGQLPTLGAFTDTNAV